MRKLPSDDNLREKLQRVSEKAVEEIKRRAREGVRVITEYESVKLLFCNGTIVVRYKQADESGMGVNGHP
jgi:hypothetical protein